MTIRPLVIGLPVAVVESAVLASVALSDEHSALLATLAGVVGAVVGCVTWIDHRISRQIQAHAAEDELRHEAILLELQHLRHTVTGSNPSPTPADCRASRS